MYMLRRPFQVRNRHGRVRYDGSDGMVEVQTEKAPHPHPPKTRVDKFLRDPCTRHVESGAVLKLFARGCGLWWWWW
jgi:hypothetical protein